MSSKIIVQGVDPQLDAYLCLSSQDVAQIVLALLLEEMLNERLSVFRCNSPHEPEEILAARNSAVPEQAKK